MTVSFESRQMEDIDEWTAVPVGFRSMVFKFVHDFFLEARCDRASKGLFLNLNLWQGRMIRENPVEKILISCGQPFREVRHPPNTAAGRSFLWRLVGSLDGNEISCHQLNCKVFPLSEYLARNV